MPTDSCCRLLKMLIIVPSIRKIQSNQPLQAWQGRKALPAAAALAPGQLCIFKLSDLRKGQSCGTCKCREVGEELESTRSVSPGTSCCSELLATDGKIERDIYLSRKERAGGHMRDFCCDAGGYCSSA